MHQRTVGSLVVVDDMDLPVGILTDRDLVVRVIAAGREPNTTLVGDIMTAPPTTLPWNASTEVALSLMRKGGFRRLPVVGETGRLIGIITLDDVLLVFAKDFAKIEQVLLQETPEAAATSIV
jgi:CBS domain-containing protein